MSVRKQVVAAIITLALGIVSLSSTASAQCSGSNGSGSNRLSIVVGNDQMGSMPVVSPSYLDLFTRFRISTLTMFSWGRGPVGLPGNVRSSNAVLRERLGLQR